MKKTVVIISIAAILSMMGFLVWQSNQSKTKSFLSKYSMDNMTISEIVTYLERKTDEPEGFRASITGSKLTLGDATQTIELSIPKNQFYLSFAPYINRTHPCTNHNLVTCDGELKNTVFQVLIVDTSNNQVVYEGLLKSASKGFVGIWLPKNMDLRLTVSYNNQTASTLVSTYTSSNTCLTTLQLS